MEVDRRGDVELVVATLGGDDVGPPPHKRHAVAKSATLELTEGDLGDEAHRQRHKREILAGIPTAAALGRHQP